jgi:hypothetical protein
MNVMACLSSALKKYGPVTPLDLTAHQTGTLGHKRDSGEVHENFQLTSIESSAYYLCHANENVAHCSSNSCLAGLDF